MSKHWIINGTFDLSKAEDRLKVEDAIKAAEKEQARLREQGPEWLTENVSVILQTPWHRVQGKQGDKGVVQALHRGAKGKLLTVLVWYERPERTPRTVEHPGWHFSQGLVEADPSDPYIKSRDFYSWLGENTDTSYSDLLIPVVSNYFYRGLPGAEVAALLEARHYGSLTPDAVKEYDRLLSR